MGGWTGLSVGGSGPGPEAAASGWIGARLHNTQVCVCVWPVSVGAMLSVCILLAEEPGYTTGEEERMVSVVAQEDQHKTSIEIAESNSYGCNDRGLTSVSHRHSGRAAPSDMNQPADMRTNSS